MQRITQKGFHMVDDSQDRTEGEKVGVSNTKVFVECKHMVMKISLRLDADNSD